MITFQCSECSGLLKVKPEKVGKKVRCPKCGRPIEVPHDNNTVSLPRATPIVSSSEKSKEETRATGGLGLPVGSRDAATRPRNSAEEAHTEEWQQLLAPSQGPDELGRLGSYRVQKVLGQGGMGVVFQAQDPQLKRPVALKAMLPSLAADASARQRFLREARATAALKHENVITIYEVGEERAVPFLVMPLLKGKSLEQRLKEQRILPVNEVVRIGLQIAEGLGAAHERGLIHRDVKPGNIWLESRQREKQARRPEEGEWPRVKILDFGLARAAQSDVHLTRTGAIVGTPAYMAPEQATGQQVDARSDLFSLGCVLYRTCTGTRPFPGKTAASVLEAVLRHEPAPAIKLNPGLPVALSDLIMRLLAKDPSQRPQAARDVASVLQALARQLPSAETPVMEVVEIVPAATGTPVVPPPSGPNRAAPARRAQWLRDTLASRYFWIGAATVLVLVLVVYQLTPTVVLIVTNKGKVVVKTDQPVQLVFRQDGKTIQASEAGPDQSVNVPTGDYDVEVTLRQLGRPVALHKRISVSRGGSLDLDIRQMLAEHNRTEVGTQRALLALERGLTLCEQGEIGQGMLWLVRSLEEAPAEASELHETIRLNLGAWKSQLPALQLIIPHRLGGGQSAALSPDGQKVLTGGEDGTARLWEAKSGKPIGEPVPHDGPVTAVAFGDAGRRFLTGTEKGIAQVWDTATRKPIGPPIQHRSPLTSLALSPDGKTAVTACLDESAGLWDVATGKRIGEPLPGVQAAFSPDGRTAATLTRFRSPNETPAGVLIRLWDTASGKDLASLATIAWDAPRMGVVFSPDSKTVFAGAFQWEARRHQFWDVAAAKPLDRSLPLPTDAWGVAFSPDGKIVATGTNDGQVQFWNAVTCKPIAQPFSHQDPVSVVAFGPDGSRLLTATAPSGTETRKGGTARLWRIATDSAGPRILQHAGTIKCAAFSPDGKTVLTGSMDYTARLWDTTTGQPIGQPWKHAHWIEDVEYSPDGKMALTACHDGTARSWDLATGQSVNPSFPQGGAASIAKFSPDGKTVLTTGYDNKARLWEASSGKLIGQPFDHPWRGAGAPDPMFSPDSKSLVSAFERTTTVRNVATGEPRLTIKHEKNVGGVACSPDGRLIATAEGSQVRFWDATTGDEAGEPLPGPSAIGAFVYSTDGKTILTVAVRTRWLRVWDSATRKPIGQPLRHSAILQDLCFSPDGRLVLAGTSDGTARIWSAVSGTTIGPPLRHTDAIEVVVFSPDNRTFLTGSKDTTARLWTVPQPAQGDVERLRLWIEAVGGLELAADGALNNLDSAMVEDRYRRLQEMGGLPE